MKSRMILGGAISVLAAGLLVGCGINTGVGNANGYVTITKHTGLFCKTYEGEMALGNIRSQRSSSGGSTLDFNVQDPKIFQQLVEAQNNQTPVHVEYHDTFLPWICVQANQEVVEKVSPMSAPIVSPFGAHFGPQATEETGQAAGPHAPQDKVLLACDDAGCRLVSK